MCVEVVVVPVIWLEAVDFIDIEPEVPLDMADMLDDVALKIQTNGVVLFV